MAASHEFGGAQFASHKVRRYLRPFVVAHIAPLVRANLDANQEDDGLSASCRSVHLRPLGTGMPEIVQLRAELVTPRRMPQISQMFGES